MVNTAIHNEKIAYFKFNINKNINDSRLLWKNLKHDVIDFNKKIIDLPVNLSDPDLINDHFLAIPGDSDISTSQLSYFNSNRFRDSTFSLKPVDEETVLKIIKTIKSNALGVDGVSLNMVLLTLPQTLYVITAIVNLSIKTGIFPKIWKDSIIKPIPKVSHPTEFKDLRPVSILPFMSKILEKVVCMQINEYLLSNNILPTKQSGFRAGRSTATAQIDVIDDLLSGQDRGEGSILILLDYSRAFDTINTSLLLAKLKFYGFDDNALKWFASYLTNRSQKVEVTSLNGTKRYSQTSSVSRGVPQGSILGPILFVIYTADLPDCLVSCNYHLYADDLQLYKAFNPNETATAIELINQDLARIADWSKLNGLFLNPTKTKYIVIGTKAQTRKIDSCNYKLELIGQNIEQVNEARNLGLC